MMATREVLSITVMAAGYSSLLQLVMLVICYHRRDFCSGSGSGSGGSSSSSRSSKKPRLENRLKGPLVVAETRLE